MLTIYRYLYNIWDWWKKSRGGKSQRREEKKKEDQRRERVRRKKMQAREKVEKSRFTVFFPWLVAPEVWKVGSLKQRVRSHLAGWEMNNCTPLWHEAHLEVKKLKAPHVLSTFGSCDVGKNACLEVKMYKTHHILDTFGSCDAQKVHAVVARSTLRSQNVQSAPHSEHFWKLRCWKSHAIVARSTFRSQNLQSTPRSEHFGSCDVQKVYAVVARSTCPSQNVQLLDVEASFCVAGARDSAPCQRWAKREGFVAFPG